MCVNITFQLIATLLDLATELLSPKTRGADDVNSGEQKTEEGAGRSMPERDVGLAKERQDDSVAGPPKPVLTARIDPRQNQVAPGH